MSDIKTDKEKIHPNEFDETQDTNRPSARFTKKFPGEAINLAEEETYWKEKYKTRPYYNEGREYDDYATAFHYGWESASKPENAGRKFEEIEPELERGWPAYRGSNQNTWKDFKDVIRDAYDRIRWPK